MNKWWPKRQTCPMPEHVAAVYVPLFPHDVLPYNVHSELWVRARVLIPLVMLGLIQRAHIKWSQHGGMYEDAGNLPDNLDGYLIREQHRGKVYRLLDDLGEPSQRDLKLSHALDEEEWPIVKARTKATRQGAR